MVNGKGRKPGISYKERKRDMDWEKSKPEIGREDEYGGMDRDVGTG
jgi:hypothetical protein